MTNTPTTHANKLLAFLLALQSPQVGNLAEDSAQKLKQLGSKLATEPDDWKDIDDRLKILLKNNPTLEKAYQDFQAKLQEANLTPEILLGLLPTKEERQVVSSSREPVTFGPHPGQVEHPHDIQAFSNVAMTKTAEVAFKHEKPAEASKTLLQRVLKWLGNQGK